jgi:hypothetical protein
MNEKKMIIFDLLDNQRVGTLSIKYWGIKFVRFFGQNSTDYSFISAISP